MDPTNPSHRSRRSLSSVPSTLWTSLTRRSNSLSTGSSVLRRSAWSSGTNPEATPSSDRFVTPAEVIRHLGQQLKTHINNVRLSKVSELCQSTTTETQLILESGIVKVVMMGADPVGIFYDPYQTTRYALATPPNQNTTALIRTRWDIDAAVRNSLTQRQVSTDNPSTVTQLQSQVEPRSLKDILTAALQSQNEVAVEERNKGNGEEVWAVYSQQKQSIRRVVGYILQCYIAS